MLALFRVWSLQELRRHPWQSAAAACAVMLGVALAFGVHTINASALEEFAQAARSVSGQPDLQLRAAQGHLDERLYPLLARQSEVARASPVLEMQLQAQSAGAPAGAPGVPLRLVGADALLLPATAPALMPRPFPHLPADRFALFAPATVFLNAAALRALALPEDPQRAPRIALRRGLEVFSVRVAGSVAAGGAPLAVMDIGAAQDLFGRAGALSRIDLQLRPGVLRSDFRARMNALPAWPPGLVWGESSDGEQRMGALSRAYRVNLSVLALVALFTGAFLVFSVLSLSVAQRAPAFALLAVLGATPRQRLGLVLLESLFLGLVGSVAGVALGTALAAGALQLLGGDLGGGYFTGAQPALQWNLPAAAAYAVLGVAAALLGGWWPARAAEALPPAQTLKGLSSTGSAQASAWPALALLAGGALLAFAPVVAGLPLAAYVSVGALLLGGIALLPRAVALLLRALRPWAARNALAQLAIERARRTPGLAAVAVGGVVASLALAIALTVMVTSFRGSMVQWLDTVLPAPLYVRGAAADGQAAFSADFLQQAARLPGVERIEGLRSVPLQPDAARPAVALIARPLARGADQVLPLTAPALPVPPGRVAVYASEAAAELWGAQPGTDLAPFLESFRALAQVQKAPQALYFVAGVWRDYARQTGALVMDSAAFAALSGERGANDLALWPAPGADVAELRAALTQLAQSESGPKAAGGLEFASAGEIRERSLRIFDRSFAVTYWLQALAIGIGLFGVAASFSAQVLARRKEFGLLAHLGLTRAQILAVVAGEGAAWTGVGAAAGLLLGLAVSLVLVLVVNPQSFHWTMELALPWGRLLLLCAAVVLAGTVTAWLAGRAAAGQDAVLAVKEDW
ncbi:MAG: ABC transporter permease [Simplicispira suum]|uniref:ABC transporter permease n=1 Tax=Simplicispira suum TaxID=2109915 RepID=UPI001C6BC4E5|nr:ABC transporter permease [Simplicispira suum]MBW7834417.1 ABC transporter permease [Simplicispira suum]